MIADSFEKLAGLALVAGFPGREPPPELMQAARRGELAGFILFRRNLGAPAEIAELCQALRAAFPADRPPLVAIDQEGGRVSRLGPPVLQLPPARRLGEIDQPELTAAAAELLARQLSLLGVTLDFAPVLDVDTNPENPVIGDRAFGREPARVIRHARAFARGLSRGGQIACGKHFPGHGDTQLDSHLALPRLSHDLERLRQVELAPFAALAAELPSLMTAHVVFDAIDPERPATLSPAAVERLLRERLGFSGVIFSDDLEMKAIADHHGVGDAACQAVAAGCDVVLVCSDPELVRQAQRALCRRAQHDAGFAAQLERAGRRSLSLRCLPRPRPAAPSQAQAALRALAPERLEERLAGALAQTHGRQPG